MGRTAEIERADLRRIADGSDNDWTVYFAISKVCDFLWEVAQAGAAWRRKTDPPTVTPSTAHVQRQSSNRLKRIGSASHRDGRVAATSAQRNSNSVARNAVASGAGR